MSLSNNICITPSNIGYGCVSLGFIYKLYIQITNTSNIIQSFHIIVDNIKSTESNGNKLTVSCNSSKSIAPGLSVNASFDLYAYNISYSTFYVTIYQNNSDNILQQQVNALIVSVNDYKYLKMHLKLSGKSLLPNNVKILNVLSPNDTTSQATIPSVFSEVLLDEDDIDDFDDLPMIPDTYWDPYNHLLKLDQVLSTAVITSDESIEDSIAKTEELRNQRYSELEEQGFYTQRVIDRLKNQRKPKVPHINTKAYVNNKDKGNEAMVSPMTPSTPSYHFHT